MTPLRILLVSTLALSALSCRREPAVDPALEAMEAHREEMKAMRDELRAAQEKLREKQAGWMREREGLEARLKADQEQQEAWAEYNEEWDGNLEARSGEVEQREAVLVEWEEKLGEWEQEIAGQQALEEWIPEEPEVFQEPVADYGLFYDELDDYGSWYESEDYGYVYQPLIVIQDHGWRPYTRGRWVCTNYGWNWISDEPFGWACYHYGRWCQLPKRGWCWVPGKRWAPSWCAWREGNGHVGWAPLPPESMARTGWAWGRGSARELRIRDDCFNFVESCHMAAPAWRHCLPRGRNAYLRARTKCCTNIHHRGDRVIAGGPRWAGVREAVGRPWPVQELEFDPIGGFSGERARHGFANGQAWRVFNPSLRPGGHGHLRPDRVAGRIESSPDLQQGLWAERFQQAQRVQREQARSLTGVMKDRMVANREAIVRAQDAYRQQLTRVRLAVVAGSSQPRRSSHPSAIAPRESAAIGSEERVVDTRPRANMPPALGELLPPGVVPLPEQGRTVEESIVARAELPERPSPSVRVAKVIPPAETGVPEVIGGTRNRPSVVASPSRGVIPGQIVGRGPARPSPQVDPVESVSSREPAVVSSPQPQASQPQASRPRSTSSRDRGRQEQMRQALQRQQEAMRAQQQQAANTRQRQPQARQPLVTPTSSVPIRSQPRRAPTPAVSRGSQQGGVRIQVVPPRQPAPSKPAAPSRVRPSTPSPATRGRVPTRGGASPFQSPSGPMPRRGR